MRFIALAISMMTLLACEKKDDSKERSSSSVAIPTYSEIGLKPLFADTQGAIEVLEVSAQ